MSTYGQSPLGTVLGPFGGAGLVTVLGVLPLSNNSFTVVYDRAVRALDDEAHDSATNPRNYALGAVDPTYTSATVPQGWVPPGATIPTRTPSAGSAVVSVIDPTQVVITTDASMEAGVVYSVDVSEAIRGAECEAFAGPTVWRFRGLRYPRTPQRFELSEERWRDFAWAAYGDEGLQAYRQDPTGDIAIHSGVDSLRKRLQRRVFTRRGEFAWAPNYGLGVRPKALMRGSYLQELSSRAAEQARLEPDVIDAAAEVGVIRTPGGSMLELVVTVRARDGRTTRVVFRQPGEG